MPPKKVEVPETVPAEYGGKWIVWTSDAMRIAGVGDTPEEAKAAAEQAGITDVIYHWVLPADERFIGMTALSSPTDRIAFDQLPVHLRSRLSTGRKSPCESSGQPAKQASLGFSIPAPT